MKKTILSVLIISVLAMSMPLGAGAEAKKIPDSAAKFFKNGSKTVEAGTTESPAPEQTPVFTIDDAVEYALANNKDLLALHDTVTASEYDQKSNKQTYDMYNDKDISSSDINTYLVVVGYPVESAKYQVRKVKRSIVQSEYNITMAVKKSFYEYINNQKRVETAKKSLENVT
ncbi:MAG: hypothetical protein J1F64_10900, partial [Oscillospiraceae bacterium]|nr:hypothetical protein [Oscillospiraceae bacterium]